MTWTGVLRSVGFVGLVIFVLCAFTPLPSALKGWTEIPPRIEPAEAIVVLAGSIRADGSLSDGSLRRAIQGMRLYTDGLAPLVVVSGPTNRMGFVEADVRSDMARSFGIPESAILTESSALTTREEALRIAALLHPRGVRNILLVTDMHHMARSHRLFAKAGFIVYPVPIDEFFMVNTPEGRLRLMRQIGQELLAHLYYRVAGYL